MSTVHRKKRNLLEFYGVNATPAPSPASTSMPTVNTVVDPSDIDSNSFDATLYLDNLLLKASIAELLKRNNDLSTEIRELDGDMKTLVYENYSKFISATDTIKKMSDNVVTMEAKINKISNNFERISKDITGINDTFGEGRKKIHELTAVHSLLQKLNFIFELPLTLSTCSREKQYSQAVSYYSKSLPLLSQYSHFFKKIASESHVIMHDLGKKVTELVHTSDNPQIGEYIGLLIGLGFQESLDLATLYISIVDPMFDNIFSSTVESSVVPTDSSLSLTYMDDILPKVLRLNARYLKELSSMVEYFAFLFLQKHKNKPIDSNVFSTEWNGVEVFYVILSETDHNSVQEQLTNFIKSHIKTYFHHLDNLFKLPLDMSLVSAQSYKKALSTIKLDILTMHPLIQYANLDALFINSGNNYLVNLVSVGFRRTLSDFLIKFVDVPVEDDGFVFGLLEWLEKGLVDDCLPVLKNFIDAENEKEVDDLLLQIKDSFEDFWNNLFDEMINLSTKKTQILLHSFTVLQISKSLITKAYTIYTQKLFMRDKKDNRPSIITGKYNKENSLLSTTGLLNVVERLCSRGDQVAMELTTKFILQTSHSISTTTIRPHFRSTYWLSSSPSGFFSELISTVTALEEKVTRILKDDSLESIKKTNTLLSNTHQRSTSLFGNIDKLFAERIIYYNDTVEITAAGVLGAVVFILVKAMLEETRLITLSSTALKEFQDDIKRCRKEFCKYTLEGSKLNNLFDDVLNSASGRALAT